MTKPTAKQHLTLSFMERYSIYFFQFSVLALWSTVVLIHNALISVISSSSRRLFRKEKKKLDRHSQQLGGKHSGAFSRMSRSSNRELAETKTELKGKHILDLTYQLCKVIILQCCVLGYSLLLSLLLSFLLLLSYHICPSQGVIGSKLWYNVLLMQPRNDHSRRFIKRFYKHFSFFQLNLEPHIMQADLYFNDNRGDNSEIQCGRFSLDYIK